MLKENEKKSEDYGKGLTPKEVHDLLEFINLNYSWRNTIRKNPAKYIDMIFDTRDCSVWSVSFRGIGCEDTTFRTDNGYILKNKIYEYLQERINK